MNLSAPTTSGRFTFQSPATAMRRVSAGGTSDLTDSAASTPTHAAAASYSNSYANSHPLSALSASALGLSSRSPTPETYAPIRRTKDKQKHSESENRRRQRLRAKFTALQIAAGVNGKKDRYSILGQAVDKLKEYEVRLLRSEQEKAALSAQLAQSTLTSSIGSGTGTIPGSSVHPPLSTPLSNFQMLQNMAVCYISLDGRILDANSAFVSLFQFSAGATAAAAATGTNPDGSVDMLSPSSSNMNTTPGGGTTADIYTSSIFALTHHQELIHTLSILRNLLCGVMDSYECTKRCMDMKGKMIECAMTIASVMNQGKIVMFLCIFVPKGNGPPITTMNDTHHPSQHIQPHSQPMHHSPYHPTPSISHHSSHAPPPHPSTAYPMQPTVGATSAIPSTSTNVPDVSVTPTLPPPDLNRPLSLSETGPVELDRGGSLNSMNGFQLSPVTTPFTSPSVPTMSSSLL